ncbi:MAG: type II secretion system F family protein [Tardiphaga sp.]
MMNLISDYPMLRIALLALLFGLVAVGSYFLAMAATTRQLARQRLEAVTEVQEEPLHIGSLRSDKVESAWLRLVNRIEKAGLSLVDTKDAVLRQRLVAAGYSATYAPRVYTLVRMVLVFALPMLVLGLYWAMGATPSLTRLYFTVIITASLGLYLPVLFVRARAARRMEEILNGFPDALDLMLVCVEAGLGLEAAFARVGMEMTQSHPRLAEQLGMVVLEMRAGRNREDALRRMADRAGADEIRAFATLLIQSTKLGSSVAQTLRVYASEMRERRRMRAEEKAHRLPVLLSIPLVACMLPVMIGVLMLPAAIRVMRAVVPALTGGGG